MSNEDKPQDTPDAPAPTPEPQESAQGESKAGAEAAKYRTRLRATEAERDALAERLQAMQRAEVERHASHLLEPSAVWAAGLELNQVLDDEGNVDPDKVHEAITTAAERLGLARAPGTPRPDPTQGARGYTFTRDAWTEAMRVN